MKAENQANGKTFFGPSNNPSTVVRADVAGSDPNTNSLYFAHEGGREEGRAYLAGARRLHRARRRAPLVGHAQPSPPPGSRKGRASEKKTSRGDGRTWGDPRASLPQLALMEAGMAAGGQSGV
jgi:hypothetical protein